MSLSIGHELTGCLIAPVDDSTRLGHLRCDEQYILRLTFRH